MLKGKSRAAASKATLPPTGSAGKKDAAAPLALDAFLTTFADVLVDPPVYHPLGGAIDRDLARSIWTWVARDLAPSEAARIADAIDSGAEPAAAFVPMLPEILERLKENAVIEKDDLETERRNTMQMGGENARERLPYFIMAMRRRGMLAQARNFGQAIGKLQDEATLGVALQTINITNYLTRALDAGHGGLYVNPAASWRRGPPLGRQHQPMFRGRICPLIEAILSHAQSQIGELSPQPGMFADHDLACKSVDRFHRLMRSICTILKSNKIALGQRHHRPDGRAFERLERPLKEISLHVTQALRRPRDGADKLDPGDVLMALNGLYLLTTIRTCRDSSPSMRCSTRHGPTRTGRRGAGDPRLDQFTPIPPIRWPRTARRGIKMAEIATTPNTPKSSAAPRRRGPPGCARLIAVKRVRAFHSLIESLGFRLD